MTGEITCRIGKALPSPSVLDSFKIPCGKCIGCKLEYSRVWAVRCTHEASLYKNNCFITLTYDDQHVPVNRSLDKSHFQKFMKRLRKSHSGFQAVKRFNRHLGVDEWVRPIRFYMCGEYGEKNFRPHYHALLFNFSFSDKVLYKHREKYDLFTSKTLSELWGLGFASIGDVNFSTASYVARYACKNSDGFDRRHFLNSYKASDIYSHALINACIPQYTDMSRAWGIGSGWYDKFALSDVYSYDSLVVNGHETRPPRYYDNKLMVDNPQLISDFKAERVLKAESFADNNTPERLRVREECVRARFKQLTRSLDYDA